MPKLSTINSSRTCCNLRMFAIWLVAKEGKKKDDGGLCISERAFVLTPRDGVQSVPLSRPRAFSARSRLKRDRPSIHEKIGASSIVHRLSSLFAPLSGELLCLSYTLQIHLSPTPNYAMMRFAPAANMLAFARHTRNVRISSTVLRMMSAPPTVKVRFSGCNCKP